MVNHIRSLKRLHGVTISYRRGVEGTVDFIAIPGDRAVSIENQEGIVIMGRQRDIIVAAADLVILEKLILPTHFDQIVVKDDMGVVIETLNVDTSPAYDNSDAYGVAFRIHIQQVATAA